MKRSLSTVIMFILVCSSFFSFIPHVSALELPSELVAKLHTDLKIAHVYWRGYGFTAWDSRKSFPLVSHTYYKFVQIDLTAWNATSLSHLKGFNVLIMTADTGAWMTTEEMNIIIEWVRGGGGLVLSHNYNILNPDYKEFLAKLGITVVQSDSHGSASINKDGKMMIDHPITAEVDRVDFSYDSPVVKIESDGDQFIRSPFVALAKNYYAGRIVFLGHGGGLLEEFSGLRLMVNTIEWVAGYMPPGWSPSADSTVKTLERENIELKDQLKTLQSQMGKLNVQLNDLQQRYDNLKRDYDALNSKYNDLQQQYQSLQKAPPTMTTGLQGLTYVFMATTIILAITTVLSAVKKRRK